MKIASVPVALFSFLSFISVSGSFVVELGTINREFLEEAHNRLMEITSQEDQHYNTTLLRVGRKEKEDCDPANDVNLEDYKQWVDETGYWVGEYSYFGPSGETFESNRWPYRYDQYKGFITGSVNGNAYRQRNVFLYPPLPINDNNVCLGSDPDVAVVGEGKCGKNGNTKIFFADQSATECNDNGNINGEIAEFFNTYTQLIGKENAVLYQVYVKPGILGDDEVLLQSQLTTITQGPNGEVYRTRSAQGFDAFGQTQQQRSLSFYRERKVEKDEFYQQLENTINDYNILQSDVCAWQDSSVGGVQSTLYASNPGIDACKTHLEETFLV